MSLVELSVSVMAIALALALVLFLMARDRARQNPRRNKAPSSKILDMAALTWTRREPPGAPPAPRLRKIGATGNSDRTAGQSAPGGDGSQFDYFRNIEGRLEHAFVLYERGRISLSTYKGMLATLDAEVYDDLEHINRTRRTGEVTATAETGPYLQAIWSLDAIAWCQAWAENREREEAAGAG